MARIKIECFEKDKKYISRCFLEADTCPFKDNLCNSSCDELEDGKANCEKCIEKNVEFVIKEENQDGK